MTENEENRRWRKHYDAGRKRSMSIEEASDHADKALLDDYRTENAALKAELDCFTKLAACHDWTPHR